MYKKIISSELGRGTIILFITMNIFNVINFLFHFFMGRMLGPADYGVLAALMSIVYIYNIPIEAIQTIIAKYTSKFNVKNEKGKMHYLISKSLKKGINAALIIFVISSIFGIFLAEFLNINFWLIFITNIFLFSSFINPVVKGVLQGRKKFGSFGFNLIFEGVLKLMFSILLVAIGLKVFGAIIGVLLGMFLGILLSIYFNRDIIKTKQEQTSFDGIYGKSMPYFMAMIVIYIALSMDIILAKRFFSPEIAGQYAVLSMLGKIVFFGTMAIAKTMFPITSERNERNEDCSKVFKKAIFIMTGLCLCSIIAYSLFPKLIVGILYGSLYTSISPYLVYSAIALTFLSLTHLTLLYGLSTKGLRNSHLLIAFIILEISLLYMFHNNILEYILAFMASNIIMFLGSFLFLKK